MTDWYHRRFGNRLLSELGLLLTACCLSSCSSQEAGPTLVPVSGMVRVNGEPLPKVGISFRPDAEQGNTAPYQPGGAADDTGKYELIAAAKNGAPPGWYKVVVFPYTPPPGGGAPKVKLPTFDKKYSDPATTELRIEVKADAPPGAYDLELK
ncbi:hypothetical protein [Gimesia maris]|uniref:hypothetical protein n=1 Tax=Gimesia maris TaxID=122 RepID=UPI00118D1BDB|nr:hypothetical protein [Gimesia maris]QDT81695.1 hypothetical protein Mal35_51790 [Gimesia maris]